MTPNAARVTFTKKKKTVACPVPLAPLADTHAHLLSFWGKEVPETLVRAIGVNASEILDLRNIPHRQNFAHEPVTIVRHAALVGDGVEHRHQQVDARGFGAHERLGHFFAPKRKQMRMSIGKRCQGHGAGDRLLFLGKRHAFGIRRHGLAPGPGRQSRQHRASRRAWWVRYRKPQRRHRARPWQNR